MKMSREIKFRGFLKDIDVIGIGVPHTGHFVIGDLVQGTEYDYIVGGMLEANEEYSVLEWWQAIQKGTADQFTGLKDINDQDAYEGDIVSLDSDKPPYQIIFAEGKFEIVGNGINYDLGEEFMDCEIIGNIHENLELLKANK
jgi:hypothetical protein